MPTAAEAIAEPTLYGVMITQTAYYYTTYSMDPRWMKIYVAVLFVADTLNSVFNMAWIYGVLINNFGNASALGIGNWLFETEQALTGIIAMQVQLFYAWRIYKLTGQLWLVATVAVPSVIGGLSGVGTAIGVGILPQFSGLQRLKVVVILWLMGAVVCDMIITTVLTWYLRKNRTAYTRTKGLISRMLQLIVSNGLLTAAFAAADVVAYLATTNSYHLIFNFPLCKLYGNTVMSTLNARSMLAPASSTAQYQGDGHVSFDGNTPWRQSSDTPSKSSQGNAGDNTTSRPAQIMVNVETHEMIDIPRQAMMKDGSWSDRDIEGELKSGGVI
ncbi:uncharacterized protein B0H18DRAFT_951667 [Fomitopsis serialis]|uniref:uncharacterized protein n=1 Tax=Fomitopsis serialis TaxID=139415 RepID=UPI0020072C87|nr:uncharacterized protein B0H18DRAFT_951667 [Neoantrodia serialis]KAH9934324.1 hypothetical protein B0H18DRAFT_951667 [Neoantrodia serialis]